MGKFYSPAGNLEVWDEAPAGYFTVEDWKAAHPPVPVILPEPTEEELKHAQIQDILSQLRALDALYLTPRILAGIASGDSFSVAKRQEHETLATPLRDQLKVLS
jgi:hypothetical protein